MHQVSTLSCCTIIPANVSGTRLGYSCSITSVDAAARSASAAHSAFPASAIAADNLERRTIREIAMLADLAKSAVAAQSSARTTSTSVFGRLSNFYYLKKGGEDRRTAYYYPNSIEKKDHLAMLFLEFDHEFWSANSRAGGSMSPLSAPPS